MAQPDIPPLSGPLAAVGIPQLSEQLYRLCLRRPGITLDDLCDIAGRPREELDRDLEPLIAHDLVSLAELSVFPQPPEFALGRLLNRHGRRLAEAEEALGQARDEVSTYIAEHAVGQTSEWQPVAVDVIAASDFADVMLTLVANSSGEMLFLRPDQWFLPTGARMDVAVKAAMAAGRPSRVIYPARVIETNPENVHSRARAGELIRVLPELPTRMAIFGTEAAVLPEVWGSPVGVRLVIRQPAIVAACLAYFDQLWSHAVTVPGFGTELELGARTQLLELLARGAKDEQIARRRGCRCGPYAGASHHCWPSSAWTRGSRQAWRRSAGVGCDVRLAPGRQATAADSWGRRREPPVPPMTLVNTLKAVLSRRTRPDRSSATAS